MKTNGPSTPWGMRKLAEVMPSPERTRREKAKAMYPCGVPPWKQPAQAGDRSEERAPRSRKVRRSRPFGRPTVRSGQPAAKANSETHPRQAVSACEAGYSVGRYRPRTSDPCGRDCQKPRAEDAEATGQESRISAKSGEKPLRRRKPMLPARGCDRKAEAVQPPPRHAEPNAAARMALILAQEQAKLPPKHGPRSPLPPTGHSRDKAEARRTESPKATKVVELAKIESRTRPHRRRERPLGCDHSRWSWKKRGLEGDARVIWPNGASCEKITQSGINHLRRRVSAAHAARSSARLAVNATVDAIHGYGVCKLPVCKKLGDQISANWRRQRQIQTARLIIAASQAKAP